MAIGWGSDYCARQVCRHQYHGGRQGVQAAAQKVRTFGAFIDTLKESIGSGWSAIFTALLGGLDDATNMWTGLSNAVGNVVGELLQLAVCCADLFGAPWVVSPRPFRASRTSWPPSEPYSTSLVPRDEQARRSRLLIPVITRRFTACPQASRQSLVLSLGLLS